MKKHIYIITEIIENINFKNKFIIKYLHILIVILLVWLCNIFLYSQYGKLLMININDFSRFSSFNDCKCFVFIFKCFEYGEYS